jgi:Flp pilus assembly protein TadG
MHRPDRVVAKSPLVTIDTSKGQVLAFFALILPIVMLPIAAYAVDASVVASREAGLQAATTQAAETAAQQLNVEAIRSTGALKLDVAAVSIVIVQTLVDEEQGARVDSYTVTGAEVTVETSETVTLPLNIFTRRITLHAHASSRLVAGYDNPS